MKRFLKSFRFGQKGFTLIELLVVVAILGILAAVIIPNVARFMGAGAVEAANTELHNVQTAVIAYMVDNNLTDFNTSEGIGPTSNEGPEVFLLNQGNLQAIYTIAGGEVVGPVAGSWANGKWKSLDWDTDTKTWIET